MAEINATNTNLNGSNTPPDTEKKPDKKPKKQRYLPTLPSTTSASEMATVAYNALVDKTPCEWTALENYEIFSMSPDGSFPMFKASCSKAVRLSDRKVYPTSGGRVYRVSLSSN